MQALAHEGPALERDRPPGLLEVRGGNAPGLADRRFAAGEWHGPEVREPFERGEVAAEQLPAPQRAVGPVAGAVEDERESRLRQTVLGQARSGVGVMVLDSDEREVLLDRPFGRQVLGMQIVCDRFRADAEHREVEVDVGAEGVIGGLGVEVTEMRREKCLCAECDAERALQLCADGEDRLRRPHRQRHRVGRKPTGAAERERRSDDRVLAAPVDRAVVAQERIGDPAEPLACLVVVVRDRLVGAVAARHHERSAEVADQQVVQRCVGKHHAEPGIAGRDGAGDRRAVPPAQEHDRPPARLEQLTLVRVDVRQELRTVRHAARTACPRDACARVAARPRSRHLRRTRDASRRGP